MVTTAAPPPVVVPKTATVTTVAPPPVVVPTTAAVTTAAPQDVPFLVSLQYLWACHLNLQKNAEKKNRHWLKALLLSLAKVDYNFYFLFYFSLLNLDGGFITICIAYHKHICLIF